MTLEREHVCDVAYEERVVAFLDVLGFSKRVEQSAGNIDMLRELYNFLRKYSRHKHAEEVFAGFRNGDGSLCSDGDLTELKALYDYRFTQFSDSFVFSVKAESVFSVGYLPLLIGQLMLQALELGFLVRGGVAKGLMVHEEDGPAFGPAFIQAYKMESAQAVFARTVISKPAFDCIRRSGGNSTAWIDKGLDDEYEITVASFLKEKYSSPLLGTEMKISELTKAMQKIEQIFEGLKSQEQDCVGGKYRYVISRLRQAILEASK